MNMYRAVLEQQYAGQQVINTFDFISGEVPSGQLGALLIGVGMGFVPFTGITPFDADTFGGKLQAAQSLAVHYVQLLVKNLYSVTDFFTYAFPADTNGTQGADGLPPINAAGFSSDRTVSNIRRAQKRFVGLTEGQVDSLGVLNTSGLALWEAVGDKMDNVNVVPVDGGSFTFTPYVFSKHKVTRGTPPKVHYDEWPDEATALEHVAKINQFNLKPDVRSQVSRQYGRGS